MSVQWEKISEPGYSMIYYFLMDSNGFSTWLEVDLDAIKNNVHQLKKTTGCEVMAVVKANGYGHGAIPSARAAVEAGSTWCGVGRLEEALALRQAGIRCKILVLGYTSPGGIQDAILQDISVTIYDLEQAEQYAQQARITQRPLFVHVKLETGMGRLGVMEPDVPGFMNWVRSQNDLIIEGVFTHFARADEPEVGLTDQQTELFIQLLERIEVLNDPSVVIHAANSAGAIYFPSAHFNLVRSGIALFGLDPSPSAGLPPQFKPALSWKARLTSNKVFPPGHGISYGSIYTTQKTERIGTIPVGYADGFRRTDSQVVLIGGKRVPVVGRICMDQCSIQLDTLPDAHIGDEVVLLGQQGQEKISAEEIGERWGTVNYEVVCGLANRLPRLYID
jgi:alanine racemase